MNVLERPKACGNPTSEYDGLTCGSVVSMTAQDLNVTTNYTVELNTDGCEQAQAATKFDHSNKPSGTKQGCVFKKQHSRKFETPVSKRHG